MWCKCECWVGDVTVCVLVRAGAGFGVRAVCVVCLRGIFLLTQLVLFVLTQLVLFVLTQLVLFAGMWEILPVLIPSIGDSKITVRRGVMQVCARVLVCVCVC